MNHVRRLCCCIPLLALPAFALGQPPAGKEYYQDFRGGKPFIDELKTFGADTADVSKKEDEGLRFTLTAKRVWRGPVGMQLNIPLSGDFEITARYEILAAERPPVGNPGVGVGFNVANDADLQKLAKFGRFTLAKFGDIFLVETWHKDLPKDNPLRVWKQEPSKLNTGLIRIKREGAILHYLAADGVDGNFQEVVSREFTDRDLRHVRLLVTNNNSPALIDVRLVDLRIRNDIPPNAAAAPGAPIAPKDPPGNHDANLATGPVVSMWLIVIAIVGVAGIFVLFALVGGWLLLRSRRGNTQEEPRQKATVALAFACPKCGKNLNARQDAAGKKIKCPHCGHATIVPEAQRATGS